MIIERLGRTVARWVTRCGAVALIGMTAAGCRPDRRQAVAKPLVSYQSSGRVVRLQAIAAVDANVAWASGLQGTYLRTVDGGATWTSGVVPGADTLQFRDIAAFDPQVAYLLAAGSGSLSRIYKTTDGGVSWNLQFTNREPAAFFDCMGFWDRSNGLAFSDAVDGEFIIIRTTNGENWQRIPPDGVPDALPGEGSFAASGMCLVTHGDSTAWFGTGASNAARVFMTTNRGTTWSVAATPIVSGPSAGITALTFRDDLNGLAAGGDIGNLATYSDNVILTNDGGVSWTLVGRPAFTGAIYGLASASADGTWVLLAVGPGGLDYSVDNGSSWIALDTLEYWSVDFAAPTTGWAVGPAGRIAKIQLQP
ncbi:MAG: hypothetical protein JSW71_22830 [Gemmatimonadota bacterium]|nr:MAG: hypothetical protein JSW71_22830 [Gemmatimonadota bacterium]